MISNKTLENSIKEVFNNSNFINNLAFQIDNINRSNILNRNNYEEDINPPHQDKKELLVYPQKKRKK